MAAISGDNGSVVFGGGAVAITKSWEIEDTANLEDSTGMLGGGVTKKTFANVPGEWSGTFEGIIDSTDTKFKGAPPALRAGATGAASFSNLLGVYSGTVIIKSLKVTSKVDSLIAFSASFQGSGNITYPT